MTPDRLLQLYDRMADAPDVIERLRRFVLALAVRGKLVDQDPNDEPASELLKRIADKKARLVKAREIRKPKVLPAVEDHPFALPADWRWVPIREITSDRGQRVPNSVFTYIDVTAINKEIGVVAEPNVLSSDEAPSRARKIAARGDVLYSCVRPYLLNVAVLDQEFDPAPIASTAFAVLNGHGLVLPWYLWIVLRSPYMVQCVEENQRGQAYPAINDKDFSVLPFPLPPLAEQKRIVARVDELMALLGELEAARNERESVRDQLTRSSYARLTETSSEPEAFAASARTTIDTLPALTSRPDQINALRQTILNLAVRGKLVEQDSNDEPASGLLLRIRAEKARLIKAGTIRKSKSEPPPNGTNSTSDLPSGWSLARLDDVANIGTGLTPSKARQDFYEGGQTPWINSSATSLNVISEAEHFVTDLAVKECRLKIYASGSLVVALYGQGKTRGQVSELGLAATVNQACAVLEWFPASRKLKQYVRLTLEQQYEAMRETAEGGPQPNLNVGKIKSRVVPLPPLAEQQRIVVKVDELMALCDELEAALTRAETTRARLLEASLHEALDPANDAMEAAK